MKKLKYSLIMLMLAIILTGCSKNIKEDVTTTTTTRNYYKLEEFSIITNKGDETEVSKRYLFTYNDIDYYYANENFEILFKSNDETFSLEEVITHNMLTMDEITNKSNSYNYYYDMYGSDIYHFDEFELHKCVDDNRHISYIVGKTVDVDTVCRMIYESR